MSSSPPRLVTTPESELILRGPFDKENCKSVFQIRNPSGSRTIAFKVKSTKANLMAVSPKCGFLKPKEEVSVYVVLSKFVLDMDQERERRHPELFLIQSAFVVQEDVEPPPRLLSSETFLDLWKSVRPVDITDTKLKIRFEEKEVVNVVPAPEMTKTTTVTPTKTACPSPSNDLEQCSPSPPPLMSLKKLSLPPSNALQQIASPSEVTKTTMMMTTSTKTACLPLLNDLTQCPPPPVSWKPLPQPSDDLEQIPPPPELMSQSSPPTSVPTKAGDNLWAKSAPMMGNARNVPPRRWDRAPATSSFGGGRQFCPKTTRARPRFSDSSSSESSSEEAKDSRHKKRVVNGNGIGSNIGHGMGNGIGNISSGGTANGVGNGISNGKIVAAPAALPTAAVNGCKMSDDVQFKKVDTTSTVGGTTFEERLRQMEEDKRREMSVKHVDPRIRSMPREGTVAGDSLQNGDERSWKRRSLENMKRQDIALDSRGGAGMGQQQTSSRGVGCSKEKIYVETRATMTEIAEEPVAPTTKTEVETDEVKLGQDQVSKGKGQGEKVEHQEHQDVAAIATAAAEAAAQRLLQEAIGRSCQRSEVSWSLAGYASCLVVGLVVGKFMFRE